MNTIKRPPAFLIIFLLVSTSSPGSSIAEEPSNVARGTMASPEVAAAQWDEIKGSTYEQRDKYFDGLKKILAIVDAEIDDLRTKRRLMSSKSNTVDWDLAIKEFLTSCDYLRSVSREATKVTVTDWDQTKEKVSQAWTQTQSAYDKARINTPR